MSAIVGWLSGVLPGFSRSGKYAKKGKMVLLHGVLYLNVEEGRDLPDVDTSWFKSSKNVSDPYVTVDICVGGKKTCRIAKTSIINDSLNPHWNEKFRLEMCHEAESLLFSIKDMDLIKVENMGYMSIRAEDLVSEERLSGFYPITGKNGNPCGSLAISMQYKSVESIIRSNEVPDTAFPLHLGCDVSLYQDAHTPLVSPVIDIPTGSGETYNPCQLWLDLSASLNAAEEFIYVLGWSIKSDICLQRDGGDSETVGNLLKRKAADGVRVLVMVWNEVLSTKFWTTGVMGTHDEETQMFFEGSEVEVVLTPRQKCKAKFMEATFVATMYTHHQKCVIVDVPTESEKRGLVAYVGGIDLTDGRWDTPQHELYKTLLLEHCSDFYNNCCTTTKAVGPRQPWHDIHARVQGPVVLDLISNFTERWRKQAGDRENRLVSISENKYDFEWNKGTNTWGVQFFRSINSDSAVFLADALNRLLSRKGRVYDNSVQRAYVHHIRRSKQFIYLENQYFLGSSHCWPIQEAKCPNLIPIEITSKICKAIQTGGHFRAYIVLPLHPEGDPTDRAVQEVLHWQHKTMEMMYRKIANALKKVGSQEHPTDYLSFFCLGKRESPEDVPDGLDLPEQSSVSENLRKRLRFMIYVHSKLGIFDDEYAIIGSANINERSLSGNRDSEMTVGCFQEGFTKEDCKGEPILGKVHDFRLSLWAEHCGQYMKEHMNPASATCMSAMRSMGEMNLKKFLKDEPTHEESHLLIYPLQVAANGNVTARSDCKNFPDTDASVLGKNSMLLPNNLTT